MDLVGKAVTKRFPGFGVSKGVVDSYDSSTGFFRIVYEDGDSEGVELYEVITLLRPPGGEEKVTKRPGRKPKRRRRTGVNSGKGFDGLGVDSARSSGGSEIGDGLGRDLSNCASVDGGGKMLDLNNVDDGLNSNDVNRVEVDSLENGIVNGIIDLNLDVDHECGEGGKVKRGFDLNIGFSDDGFFLDGEGESRSRDTIDCVKLGNVVANVCNGTSAESAYSEGCVSLCEKPNPASHAAAEADNGNDSSCGVELKESSSAVIFKSPYEDGNSRSAKKRKIEVDSSPSATVLRRSARRASTMASEGSNYSKLFSDGSNDLSSSAVSVVTEDKPSVADCEEVEASGALPLVMELPPSSTNLNLDGLSVSDVFSVYACLRSFTTTLYLCPFELEDLVSALKSNSPNSLLDSIHVSILQTIRKHLEFLSREGSESASECLRNLNWDLLDVITWPIFMVEYLLIHGSGLQDGFNLASLKLFEMDYYKQPAEVKMEVLRCLCDDMMEVDSIRSELNRRSMLAETGVDYDHHMNNIVIPRKRAPKGGISEDVEEDATDWNSDECCLCKMEGNLICCDGCPAAYHARCVGVACNLLPEGEWYCPECSTNRSSGIKPQKLIRGGETLGVDPYGRLYFSCYGYLLVSDSCDAKSAFRYYNRNELSLIISILQSSELVFGPILSAISELQAVHDLDKSGLNSVEPASHINLLATEPIKPEVPSDDLMLKDEVVDAKTLEENPDVMDSTLVEISAEEGPAEVLQGTRPAVKRGRKKSRFAGHFHKSSAISSKEDPSLQMHPQNHYMNNYGFAWTASSVAEELTCKASDKVKAPSSEEEIISIQLKVIMKKWSNFFWLGIPLCDADSQKEKCGWCYACRFPADERDCLFNMRRIDVVSEGLTTEIAGLQSKRRGKGHLVEVIGYVLSLEDRLRGLLLGPWMSLHHSNLWRANVLEASDLSTIKYALIMLEKSLRPQVLSAEWLKHVDSAVTMGSASHIVINSRSASRLGLSRKKLRGPHHGPSSRNGSWGLDLFWWRGGRLSRKLFNWKVLPRSIAAKAGRQGGCVKIPGILYPDGAEHAKRSKHVVWRAAVETSTSVEQLALQVRELDQNIRWDDIENTHLLPILDNETKKSIRLFKKVIVRRKAVEGTAVKYLLDFGKRRSIPDVVARHGVLVEDSGEKKRYWLNESCLPLHLLKGFEEKRIVRKASKLNSNRTPKIIFLKKPFRRKGLEYLVSRAEQEENYQCGHCKKDVPMRDAVSCQHCCGFFHQRHVKVLSGTNSAKCTYACHKCLAAKNVIIGKRGRKKKKRKLQIRQEGKMASVGKRGKKKLVQISRDGNVYFGKKRGRKPKAKKGRKTSSLKKQVLVENSEVPKVHEETLDSKKSADVSPDVALRRSSRVLTTVPREYTELVEVKGDKYNSLSWQQTGLGKDKELKYYTRRTASAHKHQDVKFCKRKRTPNLASFWINGLKFSRKPNDELAVRFKRTKLLPSEISSGQTGQPKCPLCCESNRSSLMLIACDKCGGWFHGHAFGLDAQNVEHLIGFRCHLCLQKDPPKCRYIEDTKSDGIILDEAGKEAETENVDRLPSEDAAVCMETDVKELQNVVQSMSDKASSDDDQTIRKLDFPVETRNLVGRETEVGDKAFIEPVVPVETDAIHKSGPNKDFLLSFQDLAESTTNVPSSNVNQLPPLQLSVETDNLDATGADDARVLPEETDTRNLPDCDTKSSGRILNKADIVTETEVVSRLITEAIHTEVDSSRKSGLDNDIQNLDQSTSVKTSILEVELPVETGNLASSQTEVAQTLSEEVVAPVASHTQKSGLDEDLQISFADSVESAVVEMLSDEAVVPMEHEDLQAALQGLVESSPSVPSSNTDQIPPQQLQLLVGTGDVNATETAFVNTLSEEPDSTVETIGSHQEPDLHTSTTDSVESMSEELCSDKNPSKIQRLGVDQTLSGEADIALAADCSPIKQGLEVLNRDSAKSTSETCLVEYPTLTQESEFPTVTGKEEKNAS
ncbi:DDT domain-containing protein [Drosera capensis]